jgi:PAS domain S-box-containing protein
MVKAAKVSSTIQRAISSKNTTKTHNISGAERRPREKNERGSWIFNANKKDLISILENLPCGVAVLGSPFGNVNFINKAVVSTLGYTLPDVPSTKAMIKQAIPDPKERSEARKQWKEIVESGGGTKVGQFICADGNIRTFENRSVILRKNLIINMWIDVTQREKAEAQLKESEARFRSFFEDSADPFLLLDGNRVVDCNPAAQKMFYCPDKNLMVGKTLEALSPERQADGSVSFRKVRTLLSAVGKNGHHRTEWTIRSTDGREIPVELSISTIALRGKNFLFIAFRDITPWKEAEKILLHAKTDLENRVRERTADLIAVNKQLLKEIKIRKKSERETRRSREDLRHLSEHLQRIREQERTNIAREVHDQLGQSLSALTIDLSRIKGRLPHGGSWIKEQVEGIEKQIGVIMQSVREICRQLRPPVFDDFGLTPAIRWYMRDFQERTGVVCKVMIDEEIPDHDKELDLVILRIFQEAMTNILRHAEATQVQVALMRHSKRLVLRIEDNGKGISPEQTANPLSLGILGIKERVRFWGGKSSFIGSPGKGTTMTVSIPIIQKKVSSRHQREWGLRCHKTETKGNSGDKNIYRR